MIQKARFVNKMNKNYTLNFNGKAIASTYDLKFCVEFAKAHDGVTIDTGSADVTVYSGTKHVAYASMDDAARMVRCSSGLSIVCEV